MGDTQHPILAYDHLAFARETGLMNEPIDIVYLWVNGDFPGFQEQRDRFATTKHDRDAARYRDNLDLLRYSFRGLAMYLPWIRNVFLITCRPQRPSWLVTDHSRLRLIYHDEFIEHDALPVYNSNAIFSFLDRLPGLSRHFLYCEDDILWTAPTALSHFVDRDGRLRVHQRLGFTPEAKARHQDHKILASSAWAYNNHLLDDAFGYQRRPTHTHAPLLVNLDFWRELVNRWPEEILRTKMNRFRTTRDVVPVYLYRHFLLNTGRAIAVSRLKTYREAHYHGLEYFEPWAWFGLNLVRLLKPKTTCLGDNWGEQAPSNIAAMVRRFLKRTFPLPSPFEREFEGHEFKKKDQSDLETGSRASGFETAKEAQTRAFNP